MSDEKYDNQECTDCDSTQECSMQHEDLIVKTHELNRIGKVIGVISGKGGVGKTLITSMLAVLMRRKGYKVGILDADITGSSIPKMFGLKHDNQQDKFDMYPWPTRNSISIMSINLLLEKEDSPVIWRGPIISGTVKQFWSDIIWGDIDYLFLDMPPGTGDVPLTVFQSIPVDGAIIVTSPQDLVQLIVKKAYNMAKMMNIPVLGIVENMSYVKCPDCDKKISLFGESKLSNAASELGIEELDSVPIDLDIPKLCDSGEIEKVKSNYLTKTIARIENNFKND